MGAAWLPKPVEEKFGTRRAADAGAIALLVWSSFCIMSSSDEGTALVEGKPNVEAVEEGAEPNKLAPPPLLVGAANENPPVLPPKEGMAAAEPNVNVGGAEGADGAVVVVEPNNNDVCEVELVSVVGTPNEKICLDELSAAAAAAVGPPNEKSCLDELSAVAVGVAEMPPKMNGEDVVAVVLTDGVLSNEKLGAVVVGVSFWTLKSGNEEIEGLVGGSAFFSAVKLLNVNIEDDVAFGVVPSFVEGVRAGACSSSLLLVC